MQIVFLAGLPRSGSTLLCGLLSQNPKIKVQEASTLLPLLNNIREFWANAPRNKVIKNQGKLISILKSVCYSYHDSEYALTVDKHREWLFYLDLINKIFGHPVKVLCTVRHPLECAASFERLFINEPETFTQLEEITSSQSFTTINRARSMLAPDGSIGKAYEAIKDAAMVQKKKDQILFIDYHKLCLKPNQQLDRIYDFLEIDNCKDHNFNNIKNSTEQDDSFYRMYSNTHSIESKIREGKRDLGRLNLLSNNFNFEEFWNDWT
tara:strand:- start:2393 stop:3187 length:795 start_codon:yes stop_codon:yes gene_type:complete